jgi:hypothetical protein
MNIKINKKLQALELAGLDDGIVLNMSSGTFLLQQMEGHLQVTNLDSHKIVYSSDPSWSLKPKPKKPSKSFEEYVLNGIGPIYKKSEDCFD